LFCNISTSAKHEMFHIINVETEQSVSNFCAEVSIPVDCFWILNDGAAEGGSNIVQLCMFNRQTLSQADKAALRSSRSSNMLHAGQRVVVLKQDESFTRQHDMLNQCGLTCKSMILCMLHLKLRITSCFVKWFYKTATKMRLLQAVNRVLVTSGINYNLEGSSDRLPSLNGEQCDDMVEVALPRIVDVLINDSVLNNQFQFQEVFKIWSRILSTITKTHRNYFQPGEIESLQGRINSFVIKYVSLTGDKQMFSAIYFHMLSSGHVSDLFRHHMDVNELPLGLLSMSTNELRHKVEFALNFEPHSCVLNVLISCGEEEHGGKRVPKRIRT